MLDSVGVASMDGDTYGLPPYFRISTATSLEVLEKGCNRIEKACKALR
jgi:aspartate aminotransferase